MSLVLFIMLANTCLIPSVKPHEWGSAEKEKCVFYYMVISSFKKRWMTQSKVVAVPSYNLFSCSIVTKIIFKLRLRWHTVAASCIKRQSLGKNKLFDQHRTKLKIFWHLIPSAAVEIYWKGSPSNAFVRMLIGKMTSCHESYGHLCGPH